MAWADLMSALDTAIMNNLGGVQATFSPQDNSGDQTITGMIRPPSIEEDYTPGGVTGTNVLRLFVRFASISPQPANGDGITVNGKAYMVTDVDADSQGGAVLKLRAV